MVLSNSVYWKIVEYIIKNLHFLEECSNPSELINIDTSDDNNIWLSSMIKEFIEEEKITKEETLSALHVLLSRDIVKILYVAQKKDFRLIDLTSKGYEEYLHHRRIID